MIHRNKKSALQKPIVVRATIDRESKGILETWTRLAGRSEQMHFGLLLKRLAHLYRDNPEQLVKIGVLAHSEHEELARLSGKAVA